MRTMDIPHEIWVLDVKVTKETAGTLQRTEYAGKISILKLNNLIVNTTNTCNKTNIYTIIQHKRERWVSMFSFSITYYQKHAQKTMLLCEIVWLLFWWQYRHLNINIPHQNNVYRILQHLNMPILDSPVVAKKIWNMTEHLRRYNMINQFHTNEGINHKFHPIAPWICNRKKKGVEDDTSIRSTVLWMDCIEEPQVRSNVYCTSKNNGHWPTKTINCGLDSWTTSLLKTAEINVTKDWIS